MFLCDDNWHIIDPSDPTQTGFSRILLILQYLINSVPIRSSNMEEFLIGSTGW